MIIVGELSEYTKETFDTLLDNIESCYCTSYKTYKFVLERDVTTDLLYMKKDRTEFVNNINKEVDDNLIVVPDGKKYEDYLYFINKKYTIYEV